MPPDGLTVDLLLHRVDDVGHRQAEAREAIGLDPDAHGVVRRAVVLDLSDARDAVDRVVDVDRRVVAEEERVVGALRRVEGDDEERVARGLLDGQAELVDVRRQVRLGLRNAVLRVDLVEVDVGLDVERDLEVHRAVVGVGGLHVDHVVDAVHLLLERRRHGLLDRDRVRARVGRGDLDLGRHDVGVLGDREPRHRDVPRHRREDRDDDRDDRPANEKRAHGPTSRALWPPPRRGSLRPPARPPGLPWAPPSSRSAPAADPRRRCDRPDSAPFR